MSDDPGGTDGSTGRAGRGENADDSSWIERALMAVSGIFTMILLLFVLWQALTTPASVDPMAAVTATETLANGDVRVTVTFRNEQNGGLTMALVEVDCDTPPPALTFEHVPADDRRTGYVICPPGTTNPTASVSAWTEA